MACNAIARVFVAGLALVLVLAPSGSRGDGPWWGLGKVHPKGARYKQTYDMGACRRGLGAGGGGSSSWARTFFASGPPSLAPPTAPASWRDPLARPLAQRNRPGS